MLMNVLAVSIIEMVNHIDDTVKFHLGIQWTVISVVVAVLGVSLFYFAKQRVQSGIEKGIEQAKRDYDEKLNAQASRIKELEDYKEQMEYENEQGTYKIEVLQNNKVISEHLNHYYRLRNMVVLDINVSIDDYEKNDELVVFEGLPFIASEESESIMSIINSETGMKLSNVTIKIQENTTRIRLLVSWENHATRELRYSDIEPKSKITGKIIYLIN